MKPCLLSRIFGHCSPTFLLAPFLWWTPTFLDFGPLPAHFLIDHFLIKTLYFLKYSAIVAPLSYRPLFYKNPHFLKFSAPSSPLSCKPFSYGTPHFSKFSAPFFCGHFLIGHFLMGKEPVSLKSYIFLTMHICNVYGVLILDRSDKFVPQLQLVRCGNLRVSENSYRVQLKQIN